MKKNWKPLAFGALLVLLTVAAYLPALRGDFVWDDDFHVTNNPLLTAPDGLARIWFSTHSQSQYFPLVLTTFRFEHALWGLDPLGYHVVNVLLHAANALLAWTVLRRLAVPGAWLAAAIFALHPVQVETAAWISELKNTESTFFYFLALLAWMKFSGAKNVFPWRLYALAIFLYALALSAKTTACTFAAAMALVLWLLNEPVTRQRVFQIAPFFFLGVAMGLVSVWWEGHLGGYQTDAGAHFTLAEKFLVATRAVWFYLGKLICPADLAFSYPRWQINPRDAAQYAGALGCAAIAALLWVARRRAWGRGVMAAAFFFVATLSPLLGFFPLFTFSYSFVADHYQYLACLGPIAFFAAGVAWLFERWPVHLLVQSAVKFFLLLTLGVLTWRQAGAYQNLETLWRDTLKKNPACWMAENNLGLLLDERGDFAEAKAHYQNALDLKPDYPEALANLGGMLVEEGRVDDGMEKILRALELNPRLDSAQKNYAAALLASGRAADAITLCQSLLRNYPNDARLLNNLAAALLVEGRFDEAIPPLQTLLRNNPYESRALSNLGLAFAGQKKWDDALACYEKSLRLDPHDATTRYNFACALANLGRRDEAITHLLEVLRRQPDNAQAKELLLALTVREKP